MWRSSMTKVAFPLIRVGSFFPRRSPALLRLAASPYSWNSFSVEPASGCGSKLASRSMSRSPAPKRSCSSPSITMDMRGPRRPGISEDGTSSESENTPKDLRRASLSSTAASGCSVAAPCSSSSSTLIRSTSADVFARSSSAGLTSSATARGSSAPATASGSAALPGSARVTAPAATSADPPVAPPRAGPDASPAWSIPTLCSSGAPPSLPGRSETSALSSLVTGPPPPPVPGASISPPLCSSLLPPILCGNGSPSWISSDFARGLSSSPFFIWEPRFPLPFFDDFFFGPRFRLPLGVLGPRSGAASTPSGPWKSRAVLSLELLERFFFIRPPPAVPRRSGS
mmetsp:Transcript_19965/g.56106  ORF Transcript_19965/g.56106 Transcript_19965/m.56106 type:complete len:342 (-) Transcript_19965:1684-2709(-)